MSSLILTDYQWKLCLTVSRDQVLAAARVNRFIGNIRSTLRPWSKEITEKDFEQFVQLMSELNRLASMDKQFVEHLKEFKVDHEVPPRPDTENYKKEVIDFKKDNR